MTNKLQAYFPMIRSREEVMAEIEQKPVLQNMFYSWTEERQEEFLDFCTGVRGVKILYDFMSKEILNPETTPERVEELLSLLLKQKIKILEVLPNDNTRIADESSLVIKDMVVELEDHSIVNLEIQKIGYKFPGERGACYSADLLLRQYKRVRSQRKNKFSYKDIKDVYTIVLFEQSPKEFHDFPDTYLHYFEQKSDTGLELNLLQKYLFVSLDMFREIQHNKGIPYRAAPALKEHALRDARMSMKIESRLEAWLAFLSMDEPEAVIQVVEKYPDFKALYEQMYTVCRNIEEVMGMFSEELRELDRNTVQLMIDEMQEELNQARKELEKKDKEVKRREEEAKQKEAEAEAKYQQALARIRELEAKQKTEV